MDIISSVVSAGSFPYDGTTKIETHKVERPCFRAVTVDVIRV